GDCASELAREERTGRQKRYLARILGAFLFRVSPRLRPGQRQLAPGTRLRWATPRRSGVERFPLRRVSFACETDGHRKRARAGPANAPRLRGDEQAQSRPQRRGGRGIPRRITPTSSHPRSGEFALCYNEGRPWV